jgi:hypothetical protein
MQGAEGNPWAVRSMGDGDGRGMRDGVEGREGTVEV